MASLLDRFTKSHRSTITMLAEASPKTLEHSFTTYARDGYQGNGPVFSIIATRALALKGVRFAFQTKERPLKLSTGPKLLDRPWRGGTTSQLIARMEVDDSLAGNSYWRLINGELRWLRPDWVEVVTAVQEDGFEVLVGYVYYRGGKFHGPGIALLPDEVAHYKPIPHPLHQFFGQSWITAVTQDADSDTLMTRHKRKFFTNAATPATVVTTEGNLTKEQRKVFRDEFKRRHESVENAYKTVFLEGGAELKVIGATMEQMSFQTVQGAGESRIASAAGVPPIVVGFSEGLKSGTYNNYGLAIRRFSDFTLRPLWGDMAEAFAPLLPVPDGLRLWYDDRDVALLQQDAADGAKIVESQASTLETLIRAGFVPETAKAAIISGSFENLIHSGLVSVQLLPPQRLRDEALPDYPDDMTVNERRVLDGLGPIEGGDAIYMPATNIPAIEVE